MMFEAHKKYIDVQYIVQGIEKIRWAKLQNMSLVKEEYSSGKDIAFYEGNAQFDFTLTKGTFLFLTPNDAHLPGISAEKDVARHFKIDYKELHKYMSMLGLARNKCAHDERFYNIKFKNSIQMNSISKAYLLGLQRSKDGSYTNGINDAFAIAVIFARTLKKNELKEFITLMSKEFKKLEKQLNTINIQEIYDTMGYPNNWKNLTKI